MICCIGQYRPEVANLLGLAAQWEKDRHLLRMRAHTRKCGCAHVRADGAVSGHPLQMGLLAPASSSQLT